MPRITYADRFDALLAKDYLTPRDRTFIESLYTYYKSKKSLTAGRRHHFVRLEKQYENRPVVDVAAQQDLSEMEKLKIRAEVFKDKWAEGFLSSIEHELKAGKSLTNRQKETLTTLKDRFSDEAMEEMQNWKELWNEEKALKFKICTDYYGRRGAYFYNVLRKMSENPDYIPTVGEYNKIVKNKYAKKVLDGYFAEAKYQKGSLVAPSANWNSFNLILGIPKVLTVLRVNHIVPRYACKGNKMYEVLDILTHTKYTCSEREIKKYRQKK
jgi:hypothetical protein